MSTHPSTLRLAGGADSYDDTGLTELRTETLTLLVVAIFVLACVAMIALLATSPSTSTDAPWNPTPYVEGLLGLMLTAAATYWTLRFGPIAATSVLVLGLTATLAGALFLNPGSTLATFFILIVLVATGVIDWRAGIATALLATGVILGSTVLVAGVIPPGVGEQSLIAIWVTLFLAWLLARPLRTALGWSLSSYELARTKTEEARLRQAELVQVSTGLAQACERLERLNVELHEAWEAAETARRMKAEFAATVGHELRTPINLIIGFSQMMASSRRGTYYAEPLPESYRSDVQTVYHNASHISSLVDDILDLSQIDAHRMALHKEPVVLARVAEEAAASVAALYAEAGLKLVVDLPAHLPRILADPVRIRQVLINLLYNAVRFTHQGGVVIGAHLTDGEAVVTVQDTGVGIDANSLRHLFEEFRQFHTPSRGHVGSGLGLAVCKRFVELHGGTIWADSDLAAGTTISFALPLHGNVAAAPFHSLPTVGAPLDRGDVDVAILDPSGETVRIVQRYLDGYRVREVKHLEQASQLARRGELRAMIVTSVEAQQEWHLYQQAHDDVRSVPTIVYPLHTREKIAKILQATAYLAKPVSRDQLARVVRQLPRPLRSILVVEDDPQMRSLLVRMLRSIARDLRVHEAADGEAGLQQMRASRPDAVVLDLLMPRQDGYAVLRALRDDPALRGLPVVVISARGPKEEVLVDVVGITRHDGIPIGEATAYLKASLDAVRHPLQAADHFSTTDGMARSLPASSRV